MTSTQIDQYTLAVSRISGAKPGSHKHAWSLRCGDAVVARGLYHRGELTYTAGNSHVDHGRLMREVRRLAGEGESPFLPPTAFLPPLPLDVDPEVAALERDLRESAEEQRKLAAVWSVVDGDGIVTETAILGPAVGECCERRGCTTAAAEPHVCPFKHDINGDSTTLCTCCEYHTGQCADDI